ncbi:DUF2153 family protein [Thermoproteus tenax]|uniref:DUF2153 domain-containing protein n=1 Tax=Thermoproteus tenax (strain ATCC 35583 / DSM 2078 / JCM 9277 / NBRC 100435 / Kra 1) TaxID=768679 RepID=G4RL66_THETK|nr:DUF2153 family protein [Thermoproteus tenax]CCC82311.1 conserved hypothetical protein [Thermoproteus tenax Kra 1]
MSDVPATEPIMDYLESMMERLEQWVKEQQRIINDLEAHGKGMEVADRLTLLYSAQAMLGYIGRVLKDFESWLSNPLVTAIMPLDMLRRLESMLREVAVKFIQVDIEHTSEYRDLLAKYAKEGRVPEVMTLYIMQRSGGQGPEGGRRRGGQETPRFF